MYYDESKFPGLELVHQTEAYDYEWDIFSIFKESETGYFFWIAEGGCSCNSPLEDVTKSDLTRGTKQELMRDFNEWIGQSDDNSGWYSLKPSGGDRVRELEEVARLR
jgi:hypothetical protein